MIALPPDFVQFYNDGPEFPTTDLLKTAERGYRAAFLSGAQAAAKWAEPDDDAIEEAWEERRKARRSAEVYVPSAVLFNDPEADSEQILYRPGHEPRASQTRGRCQALEIARQCWDAMCARGLSAGQVRTVFIVPWVAPVERWAAAKIDPTTIIVPPRPDERLTTEQRRIIEVCNGAKVAPAGNLTTAASAGPLAITRRIDEIDRELLEWLWPGRIPLGKLTLLAGDPGLGKSFVTLDMAARVSKGDAWPDAPLLKQTPGGVLLFNAEDDLADTIAPRLDKAGADGKRIVAVEGVSFLDKRRHFSLEIDLPRMEEVLAGHPGTRLVVIDPIAAYCGKVDSHKNTDVRGLLAPLAELASRHRVAVVTVTHLSKSGGTKAVYRAMGSLAFAAAARAVWAIVKDTNDPNRRLFLPAKLNLARDPDGLAYRIDDGRVAWEYEPVKMHADEAIAAEAKEAASVERGSVCRAAAAWLRERLGDGVVPTSEVIADAKEQDISERTLRRAFKQLGGRSKKDGSWCWTLAVEDGHQDGHMPP